MDLDRAIVDNLESNAPAITQGTMPSESRLVLGSQGGEAKEAFLQMMNKWFTQYVKTNSAAQQPPPPPNPQPIPVALQPPVDKIRKYGVEEFRATVDDDPERAKFWLENTIRVCDELSCTSAESLKCAISLLRDTSVLAYQWWNTLKKYLSQRFLEQKHKVFLEFKQGRVTVIEYEREFVRLSKYVEEYVSTEEVMCKWFFNGLNENIKLLVGILELTEFVVLVDRACKAEELSQEKRKADLEARDSRKISMNKPYHSSSKKSRDSFMGYQNRDCGNQHVNPKAQATSVSSAGNVRNNKPKCQQCRRKHFGECWNKSNKA
ncbi:Gag-Pol polyprotein [Gossypium australe]|uniref:Gag-Pol polyprotein n=1 Tax=Gossypium australe TaxID=47621 RepID=A0A5B6VNS4_9ROSI|nr:Gag-Pol polyprotein [Gossypium australe]